MPELARILRIAGLILLGLAIMMIVVGIIGMYYTADKFNSPFNVTNFIDLAILPVPGAALILIAYFITRRRRR